MKCDFRVRVRVNIMFRVTFGLELGLGLVLKLVSSYFWLSLGLYRLRGSVYNNMSLRVRVRFTFGVTLLQGSFAKKVHVGTILISLFFSFNFTCKNHKFLSFLLFLGSFLSTCGNAVPTPSAYVGTPFPRVPI